MRRDALDRRLSTAKGDERRLLHALLAATDDPEFTAAAETALFAISPAPAA